MTSPLSVFDLSPEAEQLYRRILRSPPTSPDAHAVALGWSPTRTSRHLRRLVSLRLVRVRGDGSVHADDPRVALERLADTEEGRLMSRRHQLARARAAIGHFAADHRVGLQAPDLAHPAWETVGAELAASVVEHLTRTIGGPIRQVNLTVDSGPGVDESILRRVREAMAAGRSKRAIYPMDALGEDRWAVWMQTRSRFGEQQRLIEKPPTEFAVFGAEAVVVDQTWGEPGKDYVLTREPMLVQTYTALFEELWQRAQVVHDGSVPADDRRILELLAAGFKDEAIARYLGVGLRTVRRRVAGLMADHGVDTRFQLGVAASRRGLLA